MINGISNINRGAAFRAKNKNAPVSQPATIVTTQPKEQFDVKKKDPGLVKWLVGVGVAAAAVAAYFLTRGKGGGEVTETLSKKGSEIADKAVETTATVTEKVKTIAGDVGQKVSETAEKVTAKVKQAAKDAKAKAAAEPEPKKVEKDPFEIFDESTDKIKKTAKKPNFEQKVINGTDDFLTTAIIADDLARLNGGKNAVKALEETVEHVKFADESSDFLSKAADDIFSNQTLDFDIPDISVADDIVNIGGGIGDIFDGINDIF